MPTPEPKHEPRDPEPADAARLSTNAGFLRALGPGLLFAGAAIGVSHLVQSTKAGAVYGLSLLWLVVLAHAMKLPALLFGPRYASATGTSLLDAYRTQGRHAVGTFAVLTLGTMFTIQAAVTIVTAVIVKSLVVDPLLGDPAALGLPWVSVGVLSICGGLLALGGYAWLDRAMKALMVVMAVSTVAAAAIQLPTLDLSQLHLFTGVGELRTFAWIAFAVSLVGWMPAPLDISVWHSLWSLARRKQTGHTATRGQCEFDFLVGYSLCVILAGAFVVLGAALLHQNHIEPVASSGGFANQLISLYTDSLGAWARPLIGICAIAVMFSTTLTVTDALPRTMVELVRVARSRPGSGRTGDTVSPLAYWGWLLTIASGAVVIIWLFVPRGGMPRLVTLATTLSFVGTPVIAWFNHRAMTSAQVPQAHRPGGLLRAWSWLGIAFWSVFSLIYLFLLIRGDAG